jgi:hypothetical protein
VYQTGPSGGLDAALAAVRPPRVDNAQPVTGLILGDSVMVEMGFGLMYQSEAWGVTLTTRATLDCDLFSGTQIMQWGSPRPQPEGCPDWRRTWTSEIAQTDPDVVLVGVGRWELADHYYEGRWRNVEDPVLRRGVKRLLDQVVAVGSSHGAHVVLATALCANPDVVGPNGATDPMNDPARVEAYDRIVYEVAAAHPGIASVLDIDRLLCPENHWTPMLDGIQVRDADGIHPSPAGGEYIRPMALPLLVRAGQAHLEARLAAMSASRPSRPGADPVPPVKDVTHG